MAGAAFTVRTATLDLPGLSAAFARRLHDAGVPVTAERTARLADALSLTQPISRRRLYWTARSALVTGRAQVPAFDAVFRSVFGADPEPAVLGDEELVLSAEQADERPVAPRSMPTPGGSGADADELVSTAPGSRASDDDEQRDVPVPTLASAEEVLRAKRFDALDARELAEVHRLMADLRIATPVRRTRRARQDRHGDRIDLRRTLRASLRTVGDPVRLARRRRRTVRRRVVMLLDISGSMEPYARAYLTFLTCAAGSGPDAEAFVFATRLTRLTRALSSRNPQRAIARAAATAPDWSSGTRIGDALKAFNDQHGRRGMARGAVVVILSDGWERDDPELVRVQMERLARLAHRIVWVNPRAAAAGFAPQAGGMAAALPSCDALLSGHSLAALSEVVAAIADERTEASDAALRAYREASDATPHQDDVDEPWASATPVAGSSVAMPSGYSPSRGRTTPGWIRPESS